MRLYACARRLRQLTRIFRLAFFCAKVLHAFLLPRRKALRNETCLPRVEELPEFLEQGMIFVVVSSTWVVIERGTRRYGIFG